MMTPDDWNKLHRRLWWLIHHRRPAECDHIHEDDLCAAMMDVALAWLESRRPLPGEKRLIGGMRDFRQRRARERTLYDVEDDWDDLPPEVIGRLLDERGADNVTRRIIHLRVTGHSQQEIANGCGGSLVTVHRRLQKIAEKLA